MAKIISGIYKIQSKCKPERVYVGSTVYIKKRWKLHMIQLKLNKHHSGKLQRHFNKYGETDLQFSIMSGCEHDALISQEQFYIDVYSPYFNVCKIAGSSLGIKRSKETCEKIRQYHIGTKASEETKRKISIAGKGRPSKMKGIKLSNEVIKRMSLAQTGRKNSEETKKKRSDAVRLFYKTEKGIELRKKISEMKKGNKNTLGKIVSAQTRERSRQSHLGVKFTQERKDNISKGRKRYYAQKNI
jgi:group I intron endonuclease